MNIDYFLKNQSDIISEFEVTKYQNVPKLLAKVLEATISIKNEGNIDNLLLYKKFYFLHSWSSTKEQKLTQIKVFEKINIATNQFRKLDNPQ